MAALVRWAHQGGAKEGPSNTLAAMVRAMSSDGQATALELDVHRTRDRAVVVIHDKTLERTTNGSGKVRSHTLDELRQLDAAHWWVEGKVDDHSAEDIEYVHRGKAPADRLYGIPTLDEVLEHFPAVPLTIEIKNWRAAYATVDVLASRHRDDVTLTAFLDPILWLVRIRQRRHAGWRARLSPGAVYSIWFYVRTVLRIPPRALRYSRLQIPTRLASNRVLAAARRSGMAVDVWTIDDEETMRVLCRPGVDGIMTNRPSLLATVDALS